MSNEEKIVRLLYTLGEISLAHLTVVAMGIDDLPAQSSTIDAIERMRKQLGESIGDLINPSQ